MSYDFFLPDDREKKKYSVSKKKCQRSFVNWKKCAKKLYHPLSKANDVDIGVISSIYTDAFIVSGKDLSSCFH